MVLYRLTNKINGKAYIGKTIQKNPRNRLMQHLSDARTGHRETAIHRAIRKYGISSFVWEIIGRAASHDELLEMEKKAIKEKRTLRPFGYNITEGGDGVSGVRYWLGKKHSAEHRRNNSLAHLGQKAWNKGTQLTAEHCRKLAAAKLGKPSGRKGMKFSAEWRENLSKAHMGQKLPPFTEEHKQRISASQLGKKLSEQHKRRISEAQIGRRHSAETKRRISDALRARASRMSGLSYAAGVAL